MDQQIFAPKPKNDQEPWDVVIVGSGPSGLTAAIYTTRGAASTLILGGEKWGGQLMLTTNVDNFPALPGVLGPDLMGKMREHSTMFGAEFLEKNAQKVDFSKSPIEVTAGDKIYLAKSVIIATGAETLWLDAPGTKELIGRGISSCAPCDAPFFKDKKVAVVGGGDSAMEEALVLAKYALEVTVVHRRDQFKASVVMQQKVLNNPKIKVMWNTEVVGAKGEMKLESLSLKNNKDGTVSEIPFDGLFIAIGHSPSTEIFKGQVDLDEHGFIKKAESEEYKMATSAKGVFVAGDVHDHHYKQAITAAAFGCMAAMEVLNYLDSLRS